jgi:hypothetical protein
MHIADGCLAIRIVANETCSLAGVWLVPAASSRRICVALLRTKGPPGARWEPAPWRAFVHANASTWPLLADQQATRDRVAGVAPGTRQHASHCPLRQPLGVTAMGAPYGSGTTVAARWRRHAQIQRLGRVPPRPSTSASNHNRTRMSGDQTLVSTRNEMGGRRWVTAGFGC